MQLAYEELLYYNYLTFAGFKIETLCIDDGKKCSFYLDPFRKYNVRRGKKFLKLKASKLESEDIVYGNKKFRVLEITELPIVKAPFSLRLYFKRPKKFYFFQQYLEDYFTELGKEPEAYTAKKATELLEKYHISFIDFIYNGLFAKADTGETLYRSGTILIDNTDHYDKIFHVGRDTEFDDDLYYVEAL